MKWGSYFQLSVNYTMVHILVEFYRYRIVNVNYFVGINVIYHDVLISYYYDSTGYFVHQKTRFKFKILYFFILLILIIVKILNNLFILYTYLILIQ